MATDSPSFRPGSEISDLLPLPITGSEAPTTEEAAQVAHSREQRAESRTWEEIFDASWPHPSNPVRTARRFLSDFEHEGEPTLAHWSDSWVFWESGSWSEVTDTWVANRLWLTLENAWYLEGSEEPEPRDWNPSTAKIRDVMNALTAVTELPSGVEPGSWIGERTAPGSGAFVAMKNGILDIERRHLLPHTPAFFTLSRLTFDYLPTAPPPTQFLQFLDSLWPSDQETLDLIQEVFGWVISGRTDLEKIVMLIGPTRAGKGVMTRLMGHLVGHGNLAGMTLASFGEQFGLSTMLGKTVAIVNDARLGRANPERVIERLLTISGNGELPIDIKYRQPKTMRLNTRIIIVSNELPRFLDASTAIADRMTFVVFRHSFSGREDLSLSSRLRNELASIFIWALVGMDRLATNGKFTVPASTEGVAQQMRDLTSPVSSFVGEMCELGTDFKEEKQVLYTAYRLWSEKQSQRPLSKNVFMRNLVASADVQTTRPRDSDRRIQAVAGIRLRHKSFIVPSLDNP